MTSAPIVCNDPRGAFMNVLSAEGFQAPRSLVIGRLDRIDGADDKRGKKSGWYVYNEIEDSQNEGAIIGIASFGDWKMGTQDSWVSRAEHQMTAHERTNYHAEREAMRVAREIEERERQEEAAKKAFEIWDSAKDAKEHPYLTKKGISTTEGLKIANDGRLIIPIAIDNEITSLQFVNDDGEKRFLTGGKLKGGWFIIEGEKDEIYIAEGYSTAHSVWQATGKTVYVAFNAGNLYEVSSYVRGIHDESRIVIAGDDDTETLKNAGRDKAEQTAEGLGIEAIFPIGFNDFNDLHAAKGIKAVKKILCSDQLEAYEPPKGHNEKCLARPSGVLGDIFDYYNVTSGNVQHGFAIQTALACCSLILGRLYKTNFNNYSSLFFLNVGETATGKEHAKTVFEKVMYKTNNGHFLAGDGYTSAGAVMSTLLDRPKHGVCTDELGRYLEAAMSKTAGNNNQREANTTLMECFGRCEGIIRPKNYSSMTMKKGDADNIKNRLAHNPAITWLSMTTPSTFFSAIDISSVKDGFINRFVISISDAEPDIRRHKEPVAVPDTIIKWAAEVMGRNKAATYIAGEPAKEIVIPFTKEADQAQIEFQRELLETRKSLRKFGMDGLVGRTNEEAMRIALIHALSEDPHAKSISKSSMDWGINYMRSSLEKTTQRLKFTISHSDHEANKKEILADLRERGEDGITWSEMQKNPPYSQHKTRELKEIMQSLKDADLAGDEAYQPPKGRPTTKWIALK